MFVKTCFLMLCEKDYYFILILQIKTLFTLIFMQIIYRTFPLLFKLLSFSPDKMWIVFQPLPVYFVAWTLLQLLSNSEIDSEWITSNCSIKEIASWKNSASLGSREQFIIYAIPILTRKKLPYHFAEWCAGACLLIRTLSSTCQKQHCEHLRFWDYIKESENNTCQLTWFFVALELFLLPSNKCLLHHPWLWRSIRNGYMVKRWLLFSWF